MRVLVTGDTGFIGQSVVRLLRDDGHDVHTLNRAEGGDIRNLDAVRKAMEGVDGVIHLAARKSDEADSMDVNVGGAKNLIQAAKEASIRWIVNVSTQSARLKRKGIYGRTKAMADELFRQSGLPVITLHCSLVYGDAESGVFGSLVRFSALPAIPVFGNGQALFRPIHRDDLAACIVAASQCKQCIGKTYDIGGQDLRTFNSLIRDILTARGVSRPIIHIPVWIGLLGARVLSVLPKPPLTVSNVLGGAEVIPMDIEPFFHDSKAPRPRRFQEALAAIFPPADEATLLLGYLLSAPIPQSLADRYRSAIAALGLDANHRLDPAVLHSKRLLGALDAVTRLRHPHSTLQKKLLVAAAIAEASPLSADTLLPREQPRIAVVAQSIGLVLRAAWKLLSGLRLLLSPSFVRRNAGL